jgi:hypothetical protein
MDYDLIPLATGAGLGILDGALREVSYFQSHQEALPLTRLGIFGAALAAELTGVMNSEIPATVIAVEAALLAQGIPSWVQGKGYLKAAGGGAGQRRMQQGGASGSVLQQQPNRADGDVVNPYGEGSIGSDYQMTATQAPAIGRLAHGLVPYPDLQPGTEVVPFGTHSNLARSTKTLAPSVAGHVTGPQALAAAAPGGSPAAWGIYGPRRRQQAPSEVG